MSKDNETRPVIVYDVTNRGKQSIGSQQHRHNIQHIRIHLVIRGGRRCYHANDGTGYQCRAGIGTGPDGHPTPEAGHDTQSVSDRIGNSDHFYATYHFHTQPGSHGKGQPFGAEITGAYNGSNNNYKAVGVTLGVDGHGNVLGRTEDHYKGEGHNTPGDYNELIKQGQGGTGPGGSRGVSKVPNLGNDYDMTWAADKKPATYNTERMYVQATIENTK